MKLCVNVKIYNKSSAKETADYLKDLEHENHRETLIPEEFHIISPALASINGDWSLIDSFEETFSQKNQHSEKVHAKQIDFILPVDAVRIEQGEVIYDRDFLKNLQAELLSKFIADTGMDPNTALYEMFIHINYKDGNLNPHGSLLVSERQFETEPIPQTYQKDIYQDEKGRMMKKAEALKLGIEPVHKKGEIMRDKEGNIKYKNEGLNFSVKNREIRTNSFLNLQKENAREIYSRFFPQHEFYVGKDPEIIPQYKWTPEMAHSHPEKAEAIQSINKEIQMLNQEIQQEPQIEKRKAIVKSVSHDLDAEMKKSHFQPLNLQMQILGGVRDIIHDFRRDFQNYLEKVNSKLKEIYLGFPTLQGSINNIFKYKDRGDGTFSLWHGEGAQYDLTAEGFKEVNRINKVQNLGIYEKTGNIKSDVEKATGFKRYESSGKTLELIFLDERDGNLIKNFENEISIQPNFTPQIEREKHLSRGMKF